MGSKVQGSGFVSGRTITKEGAVMSFVHISRDKEIAVIALSRGKVNALNEVMVEEISGCFEDLERDKSITYKASRCQ